ncbi:MAG: RNA polymerase factor sigma-54 [Bacteroidales bacterium]|nr:RNA polymerase factor sigma-54 [Bacteroidales bacterium]
MKQIQRQQLQQRLSPQQIQLMRLLQLPVTELEKVIKEEVEKNPLLDAAPADESPLKPIEEASEPESDWDADDNDPDGVYDYRLRDEADPNEFRREYVVTESPSVLQQLRTQMAELPLDDRQLMIADELVGSIDDSGYISRPLSLIANDIAVRFGVEVDDAEVEAVLKQLQTLDPPGIAARNLQECLLLQLQRTDDVVAKAVIEHHFDDFVNHRYERIKDDLHVESADLERAIETIQRLNPKPGAPEDTTSSSTASIIPDIILYRQDDKLQFYINDYSLPKLSLNTYYTDMLSQLETENGDKETIKFLQSKATDAQGFIDTLQQRHETMVQVMRYIMVHQWQYLLTGDTSLMQPLRQREVAQATGLDISTVSRMANSKYIQTDFGTIPLKECFSKAISNEQGEEVSVDVVKQELLSTIEKENKKKPLSDDALAKQLNSRGYPVARRTVAKYREQLNIPPARLRKEFIIIFFIALASNLFAQNSYYDSIIAARMRKSAPTQVEKSADNVTSNQQSKGEKSRGKREEKLSQVDGRRGIGAPSVEKTTGVITANRTEKSVAQGNEDKGKSALKGSEDRGKTVETVGEVDIRNKDGIASVWYESTPHHRVNPLGRTSLIAMPDEINLRLVNDVADFCFPVRNVKTSNYGWRWSRGHHGVDIKLNTGDPVKAAFSGVVRVAGKMGGYGNCVVLRHANGLETLYGHLSKINVKVNQEVTVGEVVGLGGSTGNSTGPHLHFECRFLYQTFDPEWILDFEGYGLRTKRLHLDKSYFGIHKPAGKHGVDYKADESRVQETAKQRKPVAVRINVKEY